MAAGTVAAIKVGIYLFPVKTKTAPAEVEPIMAPTVAKENLNPYLIS